MQKQEPNTPYILPFHSSGLYLLLLDYLFFEVGLEICWYFSAAFSRPSWYSFRVFLYWRSCAWKPICVISSAPPVTATPAVVQATRAFILVSVFGFEVCVCEAFGTSDEKCVVVVVVLKMNVGLAVRRV
jgi:hypothetical protein